MNTRAKKQLTVLIMVAMLLVLLIVAAIFLMPGGKVIKTVKNPAVENVNSSTTNQEVNKFDFVGRIFDKNMQPIANTKFIISCGPTEFITDENGYFRLNGLPVGIYKLYAVVDGVQVGETEIQLSNDGCFTVGYVFFENGAVVTMIFDGEKFLGVEIKSDTGAIEQAPDESTSTETQDTSSTQSGDSSSNESDYTDNQDSSEENSSSVDSNSDGNTFDDNESDPESTPSQDNDSQDNDSDESNTSDSSDVESEPETPDNGENEEEEEDPTYTNFSWMKDVPYGFGAYGLNTTYNPELFMKVIKDPQYDYMNTFLISDGSLDQALFEAELLAKYKKNFFLNVHSLLAIGDADVDKNLNGRWRSNLNLWASNIYDIAGDYFQGFYFDEVDLYLNEKDFTRVTKYMREHFGLRTFAVHRRDPFTIPASLGIPIEQYGGKSFVMSAENHKYVTDVGWWWYGGYDYYGYNAVRLGDLWKEAIEQLDPNVRTWIVPPIGSFDKRHDEEDSIEVLYAMYREASKLDNFGGMMLYTMGEGGLWGGYNKLTLDSKSLTSDDFLKDENGEFVLDEDGNKILDIKINHSVTAVRDGMLEYAVEGAGEYWVMTQNEDGSYNWPRARKYMEIIGNGITKGEDRESILNKLDEVHKPDYSKYD